MLRGAALQRTLQRKDEDTAVAAARRARAQGTAKGSEGAAGRVGTTRGVKGGGAFPGHYGPILPDARRKPREGQRSAEVPQGGRARLNSEV